MNANDIVEVKRWQLEEWKVYSKFYSDLETVLDTAARGYRLPAIERLIEEVRTSLEKVTDNEEQPK